MIERQTIDGREATVQYLNEDLTPSNDRNAPVVRVVFDDGESLWLGKPTEDNE
jgi:hypothetical protein